MKPRYPRKRYRKRKCPCCHHWFMPDARNAYHQHHCARRTCQRARKLLNQRRWRRKNPLIWRATTEADRAANRDRMREWRAAHPKKRPKPDATLQITVRTTPRTDRKHRIHVRAEQKKTGVLQDFCTAQRSQHQPVTMTLRPALRDFIKIKPAMCNHPSPRRPPGPRQRWRKSHAGTCGTLFTSRKSCRFLS